MQYAIKIILSGVLIMLISEIAKRSSIWGALIASLPIISIIAMIFLYHETGDVDKVRDLSIGVFWLVIPSLALFISLPWLLKKGMEFYPSLGISCLITIGCYFAMNAGLKYFGMVQ
ncbi:MAG: DUF3147 family protein [Saprospiraceae bacterium]|nr:DUF3147 family protein [Saprospiraceae bacterium]